MARRAGVVSWRWGWAHVHSVVNPRSSYTDAIHVYGGDYFTTSRCEWDPDSLEEPPFDVEHLKRVLANADKAARTTKTEED